MFLKNATASIQELLQWANSYLGRAPRIEAEILLAQVCQYSRAKLLAYPEKRLSQKEIQEFIESVKKRKQGEPLQYLTGQQNFMGLDFQVNPHVLIPRFDTEILVEDIINLAKKLARPLTILDLCTGSGAIAISLAKYVGDCQLVASDISAEALKVAQHNAQFNGVDHKISFLQGNLWEALDKNKKFDIIVSNPPYISTDEMLDLPPDVQKEPRLALWGGEDGLDFYRVIIPKVPYYLVPGGYLYLEIGYQQGSSVARICQLNNFSSIKILPDWQGKDRVVKANHISYRV